MINLTPLGFWAVSSLGETTCFLLECNEQFTLLDCGLNPAYQLAQLGRPLTDISTCIISHSHSDHMSGFSNFVFTRETQKRGAPDTKPLKVIANDECLMAAKQQLNLSYPDRQIEVDWVTAKADSIIELSSVLSAKFFATDHTVSSLGTVFRCNGEPILSFTGDTAPLENLVSECSDVPVMLGECFGTDAEFGEIAQKLKHLTAEEVGELAERAHVQKLVLFHMHTPYSTPEGRARLIEVVSSKFSGEVIFPTPLESIECQ